MTLLEAGGLLDASVNIKDFFFFVTFVVTAVTAFVTVRNKVQEQDRRIKEQQIEFERRIAEIRKQADKDREYFIKKLDNQVKRLNGFGDKHQEFEVKLERDLGEIKLLIEKLRADVTK